MIVALALMNGLAVLIVSILRTRQKPFLVLDLAWAFLFGFFMDYCVVPLLVQLDSDTFSISLYESYRPASSSDLPALQSLCLALGFIICFGIADLAVARAVHSTTRELRSALIESSGYMACAVVLVCFGPLGIVGYLRTIAWSGGWADLLAGAARAQILDEFEGRGYFNLCVYLCLMGWMALCLKWKSSEIRVSLATRAFRITAMLIAIVVSLVLGARLFVAMVVLTPFAFANIFRQNRSQRAGAKQLRPARLAALAVVLLLVGGPLGIYLKGGSFERPAGVLAMVLTPWDAFELGAFTMERITPNDFMLGGSYVEDAFYTYLPRVWFPDKPERYGTYTVQDRIIPELRDMNGTFPPGILNEAYVNFGLAYFIVPVLLAWVFHGLYRWTIAGQLFWIMQVMMLFPVLMTFRSLGSQIAQVLLNAILIGMFAGMVRCLDSIRLLLVPRLLDTPVFAGGAQ
jgi:hypothetical protein